MLRGNLAPDGAVIKPSAASKNLLVHRGRAVVFDNHADLNARIDDPALDIDENSVLVLRGAGPVGAPGIPGMGRAADPEEAAGQGRARHGADFGRAHERHPLRHLRAARLAGIPCRRAAGAGQTGDEIVLDVPNRRLEMIVSESRAGQTQSGLDNRRRGSRAATA